MPWIIVALTHPTSILKHNKNDGMQCYLIAMQIVAPSGLDREFFPVVVDPRATREAVKFVTAFTIDQYQWARAKQMPNVRTN
jgi:hypothetical protein